MKTSNARLLKIMGQYLLFKLLRVDNLPRPSMGHPANNVFQVLANKNGMEFNDKVGHAQRRRERRERVVILVLRAINVIKVRSGLKLSVRHGGTCLLAAACAGGAATVARAGRAHERGTAHRGVLHLVIALGQSLSRGGRGH